MSKLVQIQAKIVAEHEQIRRLMRVHADTLTELWTEMGPHPAHGWHLDLRCWAAEHLDKADEWLNWAESKHDA